MTNDPQYDLYNERYKRCIEDLDAVPWYYNALYNASAIFGMLAVVISLPFVWVGSRLGDLGYDLNITRLSRICAVKGHESDGAHPAYANDTMHHCMRCQKRISNP